MPGGFATSIELKGLDDALRVVQRVRNLGEDNRPLLDIAASILERSVINRFDREEGPGGVPWPKSLRALGLKNKTSIGPHFAGGKTLTDTGDLRDSIRTEVRQNEVVIGSDGLKNPVKALANQFGSNRQAVVLAHDRTITSAFGVPLPSPVTAHVRAHGMMTNLPARPFIGFDDKDKADLSEAFTDHLKSLFNGH